jgi:hypothetical protein
VTDGPLLRDAHLIGLRRGAVSAKAAASAWRLVGEPELAKRADALADDAERLARDDEPTGQHHIDERLRPGNTPTLPAPPDHKDPTAC